MGCTFTAMNSETATMWPLRHDNSCAPKSTKWSPRQAVWCLLMVLRCLWIGCFSPITYGAIGVNSNPDGFNRYNSLQARLEKRLSQGLSF
jgi:hypothetical protein